MFIVFVLKLIKNSLVDYSKFWSEVLNNKIAYLYAYCVIIEEKDLTEYVPILFQSI